MSDRGPLAGLGVVRGVVSSLIGLVVFLVAFGLFAGMFTVLWFATLRVATAQVDLPVVTLGLFEAVVLPAVTAGVPLVYALAGGVVTAAVLFATGDGSDGSAGGHRRGWHLGGDRDVDGGERGGDGGGSGGFGGGGGDGGGGGGGGE
jgi:hypothetical protein